MNGWQNKHVLTDVKREDLLNYWKNYHERYVKTDILF